MEETDREKANRLEIEARTNALVVEIIDRLEAKLDKRFDAMETMLKQRATPEQVSATVGKCLEEGEYVRKEELYPLFGIYYKRYTNESRSKIMAYIEYAKSLVVAGGAIIVVAVAIDRIRELVGHGIIIK